MMGVLLRLHADIEARVQAIRRLHPEWLCAKGCDRCCRRLAEVPRLTLPEWNLLKDGLALLAPQRLLEIGQSVAALSRQSSPPIICPMLDQSDGACTVYAQRPVACRTYGFYVQRDQGLYCKNIESCVNGGGLADVVWGNHDAVEAQLAGLGEARLLTEWFESW